MMNIKTILTPIDFSENAAKIAAAAIYVAGKFNAGLHFVFVVQEFEDYTGFMAPPVNMINLKEEIFESAQHQMDTFVDERKQECTETGIPMVQGKVLTGDIAEEILAYAKNNNCNMIIMGTHGYKGLERILFGSIADKVVKNACCPVLTINPYQEECEKK
ncbi:MAG TPA: universal stress protein [Desulfobacteraceae bacterium]|nr:universal stress protein [Desulfobacteraceae bacterium]